MKKENPSSKRSKQYLVKALLEIMENKAFSAISIKEITDRALLARMTFYSNFKSKEDILAYHTDALLLTFIHEVEASERITIEELYVAYFEFWRKNSHYVMLLKKNNLLIFIKLFENYIYQLNERYKLFDFSDKDPIYVSYKVAYYAGALWNVLDRWIVNGMHEAPEELVNILLENQRI